MDPDETLKALLDALRDNDRWSASSAAEALSVWMFNEGFMPKDPR